MSVALSTRVQFRRCALALGMVGALVLQANPAWAGTATLSVDRTGFQWGTVTDDLALMNCNSAAACSADYVQECEPNMDGGPVLCSLVEVQLSTTVPAGFTSEWSNCYSDTATTCNVMVGRTSNVDSVETVAVSYTDIQSPTVSLLAPSETTVYTTQIPTWAFPSDNDAIAKVRFTFTPPGQAALLYDDMTAPYSPYLPTTSLPDGIYAVTAQAFDRSNQGSTVQTKSVLVDRIAPELTVTGPGADTAPGPWLPVGPQRSWTYSASDSGSGVASVTCASHGLPITCSDPSGHSMSPSAGAHAISFTARDGGNNAVTKTRYFQVDDTEPSLSLAAPAQESTIRDSTPTFTPTASDQESGVVSVTCQIGTGTITPCSEFAPTLSDGTYTLKVRATNAVGMVRKIFRTFTVDTKAPATTLASGPARPFAAAASAAFTVTSNETATYQCRLDTAAFAACSAAPTFNNLAAGTHAVSARAKDVVGNTDATPATWTWTVPHDDRNLTFTSAWTGLRDSKYFRGTALRATTKNAALARKDVRARRLALVATSCATCGLVDVFHGTTLLRRVNLASDTTQHRRVFLLKTYDALSPAANVRVVTVSAGKPVIIDGLGIATR